MAWQYAAFLSQLSFLATTLVGVSHGSGFINTMLNALLATVFSFPIGWWIGELGRQTAEDLATTDYRNLNNMPAQSESNSN